LEGVFSNLLYSQCQSQKNAKYATEQVIRYHGTKL